MQKQGEYDTNGRIAVKEELQLQAETGQGPLREGVEIVSGSQAWKALETPDREWLVYPWLPAGRIGMISGPPGAGKTWLQLQLATVMAAGGGGWLMQGIPGSSEPMPRAAGGAVLYCTWEDEAAEFKHRIERMWQAENPLLYAAGGLDDVWENFHFLDLSRRGPAWGVERGQHQSGRAQLIDAGKIAREHAERVGARLLILDSLGYAYGGDDSDNTGVAEFMADWDGWGRDCDPGCAVCLVHHPPKEQAGKNGTAYYRGASSWEGHARWMWTMSWQKIDDQRRPYLGCMKVSYAQKPKDKVWLDPERLERNGFAWRAAGEQNEDIDTEDIRP